MRLNEPHFCVVCLDFRAPLLYPAAMSDVTDSSGSDYAEAPVETTPLSELQARAALQAELVDATMLFREVRAIKSDYEIAQIRRAAVVAEAGVRAAAEGLREGITELELAAKVELGLRVAGHAGTIRFRAYGQEM